MRVRVTSPGPRTEYLGYYVCVRAAVAAESVLRILLVRKAEYPNTLTC